MLAAAPFLSNQRGRMAKEETIEREGVVSDVILLRGFESGWRTATTTLRAVGQMRKHRIAHARRRPPRSAPERRTSIATIGVEDLRAWNGSRTCRFSGMADLQRKAMARNHCPHARVNICTSRCA